MCSHCLFPVCWQLATRLLSSTLNRLVTSCSNNLLSSWNSKICQQVVSDNIVATWSNNSIVTTCWQAVRFLRVYVYPHLNIHNSPTRSHPSDLDRTNMSAVYVVPGLWTVIRLFLGFSDILLALIHITVKFYTQCGTGRIICVRLQIGPVSWERIVIVSCVISLNSCISHSLIL
jgi:hypothetical protein